MSTDANQPMITIVLPTRNEAGHIAAFCGDILNAFEGIGASAEIVVVDASDDETWQVLEDVSAAQPRVRPLQQQSKGFSGALAEGLTAARGEWVLAMNADGNHRIEDACALYEARVPGRLTVGSRFVQGGGTDISYFRYLMSHCASRAIGLIAATGLRENFSSFFLVERAHLDAETIEHHMWGQGEGMLRLIVALQSKGLGVDEVPVVYGPRLSGESKTDLVSFLADYVLAALRIRRDRPRPVMALIGRLAQVLPVVLLVWVCLENPEVFASLPGALIPIAASFAFLVCSVLMRGVRFRGIVHCSGTKPGLRRLTTDIIGGRYWNEALPMRLGDLLRLERLSQRDQVPMPLAIAMLVWEKVVGFSTGLVALATAFIVVQFGSDFIGPQGAELGVLVGVPIVLSWVLWLVLIGTFSGVLRWILKWFDLERFRAEAREVRAQLVGPDWTLQLPFRPIEGQASATLEDLGSWRSALGPGPLLAAVLSSFAVWAFVAASLVCLAHAFGVDAPIAVLVLCAFGTGAAVQVRFLPGGFGQVELTQAVLLNACGVPIERAILLAAAYVISVRLTNVVLGLGRMAMSGKSSDGQ